MVHQIETRHLLQIRAKSSKPLFHRL